VYVFPENMDGGITTLNADETKLAGSYAGKEKLVNMQHHDYSLEPNVHFSPDGEWIIFRANFEIESQIYAVETEKGI
jgi:hypothetical protein